MKFVEVIGVLLRICFCFEILSGDSLIKFLNMVVNFIGFGEIEVVVVVGGEVLCMEVG